MADYANPIGAYKDQEKIERIGIPLWVHHRCLKPMFSIFIKMAYDNKMILATYGKEKSDAGEWLKSLKKQARTICERTRKFMVEAIKNHFVEAEEGTLPSVFVITPFASI